MKTLSNRSNSVSVDRSAALAGPMLRRSGTAARECTGAEWRSAGDAGARSPCLSASHRRRPRQRRLLLDKRGGHRADDVRAKAEIAELSASALIHPPSQPSAAIEPESKTFGAVDRRSRSRGGSRWPSCRSGRLHATMMKVAPLRGFPFFRKLAFVHPGGLSEDFLDRCRRDRADAHRPDISGSAISRPEHRRGFAPRSRRSRLT